MVLSFEQSKEMEDLKQKNREKILQMNDEFADNQYHRDMDKLDKELQIAKEAVKTREAGT